MAKQTAEDKLRWETEWSYQALKKTADAETISRWFRCQYTSRLHVYYDKVLILWTVSETQKLIIVDHYRVVAVSLSFVEGIKLLLRDSKGNTFPLTQTPRKTPGHDIFLWVPAFSEVRYMPAVWDEPDSTRVVRLGVNFKQVHKPERPAQPGITYLSELAMARKFWPELASCRF